MSTQAPELPPGAPARRGAPFVLYLEGPRDRDVLRAWARRLSPRLAKALAPACVILGGRQPARALDDLLRRRVASPTLEGLCLLDRDLEEESPPDRGGGLDLYTWRRRHIESYLLVPAALERCLAPDDARLGRMLRELLPTPEDEAALASFDAKRFLGAKGPVAQLLGGPFPPGRIARAMRREEIAPEVHALLGRLAVSLGAEEPRVAVHVRPANARRRREL